MLIAHLSDLHLRHHLPGSAAIPARRSRVMPELLARALGLIGQAHPDLLVLSGDLLDYPLDQLEESAIQELGEQDLRLIAGILTRAPCPVVAVPGNHDHMGLMQRVFGHLPKDQVVAGHRVLTFWDTENAHHVPKRVGDERRRFQRALADAAAGGALPQIHVQHYLVWPERNDDYPHTYGDGADLREAIAASGRVRLVLSGHYHRGEPPLAEKGAYFATVPAFCEAPHPIWLYQLAGDAVHWRALQVEA